MKKGMFTSFLIVTLICLICSVASASTPIKWKWAHHQPVGSLNDTLSRSMIKEIEEKTGGAIQITLFPAGQLGDWMEMSAQIMRGSIDVGLMPVNPSFDQRVQIRVMPYSVMDWKEAYEAYYGKDPYIYNILAEAMEGMGLKPLGTVAEGFGGAGFAKIPDFDVFDPKSNKKGYKMRFSPGNRSWEVFVTEMGFTPTPVPWGELYLAMQTGLVDCEIGAEPFSTWTILRDVLKLWAQYNTHFQNSFVYMNMKAWKNLTPEQQKIVQEVCAKYAEQSFSLAKELDTEYMRKMKESGTKILIPTEEQLLTITNLVRTKVWPVMDDVVGKETMDLLRLKCGVK